MYKSSHSCHTAIKPESVRHRGMKTNILRCFKMGNRSGHKYPVVRPQSSHKCGGLCLGPLAFHSQARGDAVRLSQGCRLAERPKQTFRNGLVFSSRPVEVEEKICLEVVEDAPKWHGALRLGFTNVPPAARTLPLPAMAIPDITDTPGHWAAPVHESYCQPGSQLDFWVSSGGSVYVTANGSKHKLLSGVDLSKPLWAMLDVYGQTNSIFLLGSKRTSWFETRTSCPAPARLTSPITDNICNPSPDVSSRFGISEDPRLGTEAPADEGAVSECVVCMAQAPRITLPCGHRCLCQDCFCVVSRQFGTCPLCRQRFGAC